MLTQEQANQLALAQNQLEQAEISYNELQNKINSYEKIMNEVSANYNSYSPEKKAQIDSLLPQLSEQYALVKQQRQNQYLAQYEAQQQINYYNQLNAQQAEPVVTAWQRRRTVSTPTYTPTYTPTQVDFSMGYWETPYSTNWYGAYTSGWIWAFSSNFPNEWWVDYNVPWWVNTEGWPRYVGVLPWAKPIVNWVANTLQDITPQAKSWQYMTPMTEMVGWMSTVDWPRMGYIWGNTTPTQYVTPVTDVTLPGWISTTEWPRYVWGR